MDIRAKRSRDKIIDTFLELRKKKKIEKITVTEICKIAQINKSTFYAHFHDVYDLTDMLETQLVNEILSSMKHPETIMSDRKAFTIEISKLYIAYKDKIDILFSDSRSVYLPQRICKSLKSYIFKLHPEYIDDPEINISLSYSIYGGFYAYNDSLKYDADKIVDVISDLQNK